MSPHTKLALAVLGAVLTAAAAAYYAWWRGRELHREMDAVLDHLARFENNLIGEPGDPEGGELGDPEGGELGRQARNLERLRLIVESEPPPPPARDYAPGGPITAGQPALVDPEPQPPATARMPVVAALIPTTAAPPTGPADIPATDGNGDPPQQPSARAYSLTGPRPRPPGAHRPPKEREA
jgi:hypothetical protein